MLSAPTRRVRHLHLQATSPAFARRGANLVEDALRTASLPFADQGRLVVIRRLHLGRLDPFAAASTISLQLESAVRQLESSAIRFDAPGAEHTTAVFFPSTTAAITQLARRLARHLPATEWFWRSALLGWNPQRSRSENWLWLIEQTLDDPAAAAAVVAEAASGYALNELLAAIPAGRGTVWLRQAGWSLPVPSISTQPVRLPEADRIWLTAQFAALPPHDDRILWLGTMLALAHQPALAANPALPSRVQATLAGVVTRLAPPLTSISPPASPQEPAATSRPSRRGRQPECAAAPSEATASQSPGPDSRATSAPSANSRPAEPPAPAQAPAEDSTPPEHPLSGDSTNFAGLLFLIPVLRRLGLEARLAREPALLDASFPARLLLHAGQQVGLAYSDPLARVLRSICDDTPSAKLPLEPWLAAVRRWCRRATGRHLRAIVLRPGHLLVAPAHLDLTFAPEQADLALRRAGLDLDPGWVPWLGLVIRYHYSVAV